MTKADHPPTGEFTPGGRLADALESMAREGADMAPPHDRAYAAVRSRVRVRRAAKSAGAGMMSVAAVAIVAAGAMYEPPTDLGYAPGLSGFTTAPSVPGLGSDIAVPVLSGHQPTSWKGTKLACGSQLPAVLGDHESSLDGDGDGGDGGDGGKADRGNYGLEILDARRDTMVIRRAEATLSGDIMAGQISYVWTQGDQVVSLPPDFMGDELQHVDGNRRHDAPSTISSCVATTGSGASSSPGGETVPYLPEGTYELRAYQYLVPAGLSTTVATIDRSIDDLSSWSRAIEVQVTKDHSIVPID